MSIKNLEQGGGFAPLFFNRRTKFRKAAVLKKADLIGSALTNHRSDAHKALQSCKSVLLTIFCLGFAASVFCICYGVLTLRRIDQFEASNWRRRCIISLTSTLKQYRLIYARI